MDCIRDRLWIWGHPVNSMIHHFGIEEKAHLSPREGMDFIGAKNIFWVPVMLDIDRRRESTALADIRALGWSIEVAAIHPEHVTEIAQLAREQPNIKIGIFDDFYNEHNYINNSAMYSPDLLRRFREELHAAGVELWVVLYTRQLDMDEQARRFLAEFDGVSLWFWNEDDVRNYDTRIRDFLKLTEGKKRLIGCYLYDFGGCKKIDPASVLYQLENDKDLLCAGLIDGIVLHTNAVMDIGGAGVEAARQWIAENGDLPVNCLEK